jgi:hypothetical protein
LSKKIAIIFHMLYREAFCCRAIRLLPILYYFSESGY